MEELTNDVLKIAEGIHNYSLAAVLQSVVIVLLFVFVLYFLSDIRVRAKQLESQTRDLNALTEFVKTLRENAMRNVNIDQTRILISSELERSKNAILFFIGKTIQKNNLSDKDAIKEKVTLFSNKTYGANISVLNKFDYQQKPLSSFFEEDWRDDIREKMIEEFEKFEKVEDLSVLMDCNKIEAKYSAFFDEYKRIINSKIDEIISI